MTPEQRKKLEEEQNSNSSSFSLPDFLKNIGSDIYAGTSGLRSDIKSIGKGVVNAAIKTPAAIKEGLGDVVEGVANTTDSAAQKTKDLFSMGATNSQPVFQTRTLAEKRDMANEIAELDRQEAELEAKYGKFNPLEGSLADFESQVRLKSPSTPLSVPSTIEEESKATQKSTSKTFSNTATTPTNTEQPEEEEEKSNFYDLTTSEPTKNTEYEEALRRQEEGLRLASLLAASSQIGRSIAGSGRLSDSTDEFKDIATLYGDDRRVLDETAKRAEVDEAQQAMDPNSNVSRAVQLETAELLKMLGQEVRDPEALSKRSARALAPQIAMLKQRVEIEQKKAQEKRQKELDDKNEAYRRDYMAMQERQSAANLENTKELRAIKKEDSKEAKEEAAFTKQEDKAKDWLSKENENISKLKAKVFDTKQNATRLRRFLTEPVNSVEQLNQIYSFIKNLDNTAVREGEIKLFREGQSVFEELDVIMSRYGSNPKVISDKQFQRLTKLVLDQADKVDGYYDKVMKDSQARFKIQADKLIAKNPEYYGNWHKSLDEDYYAAKEKAKETKSVVKKFYSKSADKTKLVYSDGSEEVVDGEK